MGIPCTPAGAVSALATSAAYAPDDSSVCHSLGRLDFGEGSLAVLRGRHRASPLEMGRQVMPQATKIENVLGFVSR